MRWRAIRRSLIGFACWTTWGVETGFGAGAACVTTGRVTRTGTIRLTSWARTGARCTTWWMTRRTGAAASTEVVGGASRMLIGEIAGCAGASTRPGSMKRPAATIVTSAPAAICAQEALMKSPDSVDNDCYKVLSAALAET